MRDIYKYNSIRSWKEYYSEKAKGFPYSGSAALKPNDGCSERPRNNKFDEPCAAFMPYWIALELIHEGKECNLTLDELLAKCKENYKHDLEWQEKMKEKPRYYKGHPIIWKNYRPTDERFNDPGYGHETWIATLPFRANEEDKKVLNAYFFIPYHIPYGDGRDCTGVKWTARLNIYTAQNKTVILHRIQADV